MSCAKRVKAKAKVIWGHGVPCDTKVINGSNGVSTSEINNKQYQLHLNIFYFLLCTIFESVNSFICDATGKNVKQRFIRDIKIA